MITDLMQLEKITATAFSWFKQIIFIILVTLFISVFIIQTYDINDVSMEPTFDPQGNRVLVFLTPYLFNREPNHGDIVIIDSRVKRQRTWKNRFVESPLVSIILQDRNEHLWVKRVIGLPGDSLMFEKGFVYRNGRKLAEDYTRGKMFDEHAPVIVPEDHVYVMGDNRNMSTDSRQIGPVPLSNVQGRVIIRIYPFNKLSVTTQSIVRVE